MAVSRDWRAERFGTGRARDPASVAYDGEVQVFLSAIDITGSAVQGAVVIPRGIVSPRTGISSVYWPAMIAVPPGGDPAPLMHAWESSLQYNFRIMFGPTNDNGKPLREKRGPNNWVYVRPPWWIHVDWGGPVIFRGLPGIAATIRIGPQSARPRIEDLPNAYVPVGG